MDALIQARAVGLRFGRKQALDDLSFEVQPGEACAMSNLRDSITNSMTVLHARTCC